jgi:hypothetical protein
MMQAMNYMVGMGATQQTTSEENALTPRKRKKDFLTKFKVPDLRTAKAI